MTDTLPSEEALISRLFVPVAGEGSLALLDDVALLPSPTGSELVLTVDTVVADVHFFRTDPPEYVARKALRVNLSDIAAKGAEPLGFLLSLSLPVDTSLSWVTAFSKGLGDDARAYACPLLGGDTVRTPGPLTVSITVMGRVPAGAMVRRTGAKAGDILAVTGTIGDSVLGLQLQLDKNNNSHAAQTRYWLAKLTPEERSYLTQRYLLPEPRNAIAEILREYATGAMDVSDGLIGDARKFLHVSGVSGRIDLEKVPLSNAASAAIAACPELLTRAVTGGDDYEVLCSVPADRFDEFQRQCKNVNVDLTSIGVVSAGSSPLIARFNGADYPIENASFSHF